MPYSSPSLDDQVLQILKQIQPIVVYDIGAGAGKYGRIVKKNLPNTRSVAVEIDTDYIKKFDLREIYTEVLEMSANDLISERFYDANFDTIIIGDCIEHLKKSDGLDLLNFLVYRARWILIQYPLKYLQNTFEGKHQEAHISVWGDNDFISFEVEKKLSENSQECVLIKGYLE